MHHRHLRNRVTTALLGLLGALGVAPAMAQINLYAEVSTYASHEREDTSQQFSDADYLAVDGPGPFARLWVMADSDGQPQLYNGLGISWAQVAVGGVHLHAQAQSVSVSTGIGPQHTTGRANAAGIVTDVFGLNVPGTAAGAILNVTAQVRIDGHAEAATIPTSLAPDDVGEVAAFSGWQSWVRLSQGANGPALVELRAREDCDQRTSSFGIHGCVTTGLTGLQTISFQIVNQGPQLQIYLNASIFAGTSNYHLRAGTMQADSLADMSNTLAWAGVTEIRDASGALVSDYSLLSASSGFDYRNAYVSQVPDAPQATLLAAGLGLIGLARRRRLHLKS